MYRMQRLLPGLIFAILATFPAGAFETAPDTQNQRCREVMEEQLKDPYPPSGAWHNEDLALAAYWLNKKTGDADRAILSERKNEFPEALQKGDFHWHAYLLERIYFLFSKSSKHFPGRMGAEAEAALLDMLWQWAGPRCRLEMTLPERDWWQWGSENHHAQAWSSFRGAAQIFAQHPDYKDRRYADGTSPAQMAKAFDDYFKRFARERAAKGLLVECNSAYNKYTLGGWYNIADFASDPELQRRFGMLLDLFWTDWAVEQIDGVRGGSRHRCYPGATSTEGSGMDSVAWFHFGLGEPKSQHPSAMCAATTFWRPSKVTAELAADAPERGSYEYLSRRPGLRPSGIKGAPPAQFASDPKHPFFDKDGVSVLSPDGGGLLRYTYCTPDFVMGTSMVGARPNEDWAAVSSQNRWEGVIFGGHPTARIFVQPLQPKKGSFYNANWSAQRHSSMIVQRLKSSKGASGQRIWFDASLPRTERDGWVFTEAPRAYAAVRVTNGEKTWEPDTIQQHRDGKGATDAGEWLACRDEFSPVIIEVARKSDYPDLDAFAKAVLALPLKADGSTLTYTGLAGDRFTFFTDYSRPPEINGQTVNYSPAKVYDCPFVQSDFGSGVVTIQKGNKQLVLDFNSP